MADADEARVYRSFQSLRQPNPARASAGWWLPRQLRCAHEAARLHVRVARLPETPTPSISSLF